jgi:hypothetical protein
MATSVYFNNFAASQEQLLIENLVIESIKIYGHDVYYLPKTLVNKDEIYGEASITRYDDAYFLEMYIRNVEGFGGEGDFLSKFNLQIRDQMTLTVARRTFEEEVASRVNPAITRPNEGDLIYFPLNKKIFQIKFVEHEPVFYQMGALQMYDLKCELFEYSDEIFNTGIKEIDSLADKYATNLEVGAIFAEGTQEIMITDEDGYPIIQEFYDLDVQDTSSDNKELQIEGDLILDFTEKDPFSEGGIY